MLFCAVQTATRGKIAVHGAASVFGRCFEWSEYAKLVRPFISLLKLLLISERGVSVESADSPASGPSATDSVMDKGEDVS